MKRIYPRFMIVFYSLISALFVFAVLAFGKDVGFFSALMYILLAVLLLYVAFTTKIEYHSDFLFLASGWNKVKILYSDIIKVFCAAALGGYWLQSYDTRERKFLLFFPFEHKKMRELFETIEKCNPNVQIEVWWYKKQAHTTNFKAVLKWVLFILIVLAIDFIRRHVIGK